MLLPHALPSPAQPPPHRHRLRAAPLLAAGAIVGSASGIAAWLACTQIMSGSISVDTAGLNAPLLTGSILSVGVSAILLPIISLVAPCKPFDWEELNTKITTTEDVVRCRQDPGPLASLETLRRVSAHVLPLRWVAVVGLAAELAQHMSLHSTYRILELPLVFPAHGG